MVHGDPLTVVGLLVRAFDRLRIRYLVGGSVASSVYGVPRSTQDVDLVAEVLGKHVDPLVSQLSSEFYVDAEMIRDAIARQASFNVVHLKTMFKADVFAFKRDPWMVAEMDRARIEILECEGGPLSVRFASPEDTLLHKLVWYRLGNEVSERQWRDIVGIVEIQGERLDPGYLDQWAEPLGVADLLARARARQ